MASLQQPHQACPATDNQSFSTAEVSLVSIACLLHGPPAVVVGKREGIAEPVPVLWR